MKVQLVNMFGAQIIGCQLFLLIAVASQEIIDFCKYECRTQHLACNNDGAPGPDCPEGVRLVNMFNLKNFILDMMNRQRNEVAAGSVYLKPAAHMTTMQWDDDLADMATLAALTCKESHNKCIYTLKHKYAGTNRRLMDYSEYRGRAALEYLVGAILQEWYSEGASCPMSVIDGYNSRNGYPGTLFGEFTHLVNERNDRVGCGATRFESQGQKRLLLVCHFKYSNYPGYPTYTPSVKSAIGCISGRSRNYTNLCSTAEDLWRQ